MITNLFQKWLSCSPLRSALPGRSLFWRGPLAVQRWWFSFSLCLYAHVPACRGDNEHCKTSNWRERQVQVGSEPLSPPPHTPFHLSSSYFCLGAQSVYINRDKTLMRVTVRKSAGFELKAGECRNQEKVCGSFVQFQKCPSFIRRFEAAGSGLYQCCSVMKPHFSFSSFPNTPANPRGLST